MIIFYSINKKGKAFQKVKYNVSVYLLQLKKNISP